MSAVLLIDNYDSFVWNLARYVAELGCEPLVRRHDAITLEAIAVLAPSHIILSPGPCTPREAGISTDVVRRFGATLPTLGVCLGHQCIAAAYGGRIVPARQPIDVARDPAVAALDLLTGRGVRTIRHAIELEVRAMPTYEAGEEPTFQVFAEVHGDQPHIDSRVWTVRGLVDGGISSQMRIGTGPDARRWEGLRKVPLALVAVPR